MESNDTSVRILDLLFELTYAERGRSRSQIRRLTHYRKLSDTAFDSAFTRDKETLKKIGVDIEVKPRGDELIYRLRRSDPELLTLSLEEVSLLDLASTAWNEPSTTELASTKLRASSAVNRKSTIDFHLSGAEHVLPLFQAITSASVVSFAYRSPRGTDNRAVEPWNLLISGSAIYLQGYDLDRGDERSFRLSRILPPIEVLGEPGDAYPRPSNRPTIGISRPLEPSFFARVGSEAWKRALRDDRATGAGTVQWQCFRGHVAPYSFWTHFILSHAQDVVPIGPTEFASDLQDKLQSALSLNGGQNA